MNLKSNILILGGLIFLSSHGQAFVGGNFRETTVSSGQPNIVNVDLKSGETFWIGMGSESKCYVLMDNNETIEVPAHEAEAKCPPRRFYSKEIEEASAEIGSCKDQPENPPIDFTCRTSAGVLFKRVQNGYQDLGEGGKIWYDGMAKKVNQYESLDYCRAAGQTLPSKTDFQVAESHGFREVFRDMKRRYFWSSSLRPYNGDFAGAFSGTDGEVGFDYRFFRYHVDSARCVGSAGVQ